MNYATELDVFYMKRALQLAKCGSGRVSPNPMVGAIIVVDGKVIGEGYHRIYGEAHAEVNAVNSVKDKGLLKHSTMYVTLEPCSHYGKTPPCCNLIIESKIPRVVVACLDPFPLVSGRGVKLLRDNGVDVTVGVLKDEAESLNRSFIRCHNLKRPSVMLKWCESADGFIAARGEDNRPKQIAISSPTTMAWMHSFRGKVDAILVGSNTVLVDNPSLSTRLWYGRDPIRVTVDMSERLLGVEKIFNHNCNGDNILFCAKDRYINEFTKCIVVENNTSTIETMLTHLYQQGITSLMVEGGADTIQRFIDCGLWDTIRREVSNSTLLNGVKSPIYNGKAEFIENISTSSILYYYK